MQNDHVSNLMNTWTVKNTIMKPVKRELIFEVIDQIASLFASGSYYYYIFNFENLEMEYVDPGVKEVLGVDAKEFSLEKILELMYPEDIKAMAKKEDITLDFLFKKTKVEDIAKYKVVYLFRLKRSDGEYRTILHQAQTLTVSHDGKIQQVIGIHTDVTHLNIPVNDKVSFISKDKKSYYNVGSIKDVLNYDIKLGTMKLTKREKDVLSEMMKGKNGEEIAEALFISPHTVTTHRKNLLRKTDSANAVELVSKCFIEGLL